MNGNKLNIIAIIILLIAFACSSSKQTTRTRSSEEAIQTTKPSIPTRKDTSEVDSSAIKGGKLDTYRIAVLLPLFLDSLNDDSSAIAGGNYLYNQSRLGLELYEGIALALDSLKKGGMNLIVNVYDTKKDEVTVKKIFSTKDFDKTNLIIGSVFNNTLREAAQYAKDNKIPLVSPLSPATTITLSNPYYIMANSSSATHCQSLYQYITDKFYDKNIILIHQDDAKEKNIAAGFYAFSESDSNIAKAYNDSIIFEYTADTRSRIDSNFIDRSFSQLKENIVIIPSYSEPFVNHIINQLAKQSYKYNISVFGMPTWENYTSLKADQVESLNLHISTSYWIEKNKPAVQKFEKKYFTKYKGVPTPNVYVGYGLMLYFGNLLQEYGTTFIQDLPAEDEPSLYTHFLIKPSMSHIPDKDKKSITIEPYVNYYENNYVTILKFKDYGWVKIK